jgi:hypothetical protein
MKSRLHLVLASVTVGVFILVTFVASVHVQGVRGEQWESCSVNVGNPQYRLEGEGSATRGYCDIMYYTLLSATGAQVERVYADAPDVSDAPLFAQQRAIAKLGAEGWELTSTTDKGVIYFKRRAQ